MNKILCKVCKESKFRCASGRKNKEGKSIFVDDAGSRWYGRVCNTCMSTKAKGIRQETSSHNELIEKPRVWNKYCTFCSGKLAYPRYYYHEGCGNKLVADCSGNLVYHILGF